MTLTRRSASPGSRLRWETDLAEASSGSGVAMMMPASGAFALSAASATASICSGVAALGDTAKSIVVPSMSWRPDPPTICDKHSDDEVDGRYVFPHLGGHLFDDRQVLAGATPERAATSRT